MVTTTAPCPPATEPTTMPLSGRSEPGAPALRPLPAAIEELFDHEPSPTASLPSPMGVLESLTRLVVEILAGARDLDQIARWVSDDVYRTLLKRTVLSTRARQARGERVSRPAITLGTTRVTEPADGIIEAVTIVHGRGRSRAVAIRLEGLDRRWRATAIAVL